MAPIRAWIIPGDPANEPEVPIEENLVMRKARKEEIGRFLNNATYFVLATVVLGGVILAIALVAEAPAPIIKNIISAYLFPIYMLLLLIIFSRLIASDRHVEGLCRTGMRVARRKYSSVRSTPLQILRCAVFFVKDICMLELVFLLGEAAFILANFTAKVCGLPHMLKEEGVVFECSLWWCLTGLPGAQIILVILVGLCNSFVRDFKGRDDFGEFKGDRTEEGKKEKNEGIISAIATHIGLVWGVNDSIHAFTSHLEIFYAMTLYITVTVLPLGVERKEGEDTKNISSYLYEMLIMSGYNFVVIILPSYVAYLSILVGFSILHTKWANRSAETDLELTAALSITEI